MKQMLLRILWSGCAVAQSATASANGTAVASSAASITTSLELTVDGMPNWPSTLVQVLIILTDLWDIAVGPVSSANITTTVEATAVPSSSLIPPPFLASYSFPMGRQIPEVTDNVSWTFPKDFMLGVAGAAFQIEGAAKAEGRGPSVWDKLTRVPGYTAENQTGDITDNHYFLYKQGERLRARPHVLVGRRAADGKNRYRPTRGYGHQHLLVLDIVVPNITIRSWTCQPGWYSSL